MASKDYALLDMQDENDEINLDFQEFPASNSQSDDKDGQTVYFNNFPESHADDNEEKLNLIEDEDQPQQSSLSLWSFEYYQQYFNVNTKQVGDRVIWSMVPKPGVNYLESYIRPNPDLYGPFWISVTLVLTTAIIGNLVSYLDSHGKNWRYDFNKVTLAASSIFSYTLLVPIAVWGILLWKGSRATFSLFELICIYGYSLSIFVPVSILWIVPLPWLQWCLGIVSSVVSGSVLMRTILSAVPHETQKLGVAAVVFIVHAGLALSFMLFFFNNSSHGLQTAMSLPAEVVAGNVIPDSLAHLDKNLSNVPSQMSKRNEMDVKISNISTSIKTESKENNTPTNTSVKPIVTKVGDNLPAENPTTKQFTPKEIVGVSKTNATSVNSKNNSSSVHM